MKHRFSAVLLLLLCGSSLFFSSCGGGGSSGGGPVTLTSIAINPATPIYEGMTEQFSATAIYSDATTMNLGSSVTWTSSNTSVAAVTADGFLTSFSTGTTTITATYAAGGKSGTTLLSVNPIIGGATSLMKTGQTVTYAEGDDGSLQAGAALPNPRFTTVNGNTVRDELTGLIWSKDANPIVAGCTSGAQSWTAALNFGACLNLNSYLTYSDWRLPNRRELKTLVNYGTVDSAAWLVSEGSFTNVGTTYWSSSTYKGHSGTSAWDISFNNTNEYYHAKWVLEYIWPVRGGQPDSADPAYPANSLRTGQTTSYAVRDDGDIQYGVAWPNPRFTNPDGTAPMSSTIVLDLLTGLIWTRNADAPGPAACSAGGLKTWQEALAYVACLNTNRYLGFIDWRLPNVNELESLVSLEQLNTSSWLLLRGFESVKSNTYWSSTTDASNTDNAWTVKMDLSYPSSLSKISDSYVWPVRTP